MTCERPQALTYPKTNLVEIDDHSARYDQFSETTMPYNELTPAEAHVILRQGTERPSDGGYTMTRDDGTYVCRQCHAPLFRSEHKFISHCGWPSFDDEVSGAVERRPDADGHRVEIVCKRCLGHLGHVFEGERLTDKNLRHCVNSTSMKFIPAGTDLPPLLSDE